MKEKSKTIQSKTPPIQPKNTRKHRIRVQFDIEYGGSPGKIMDGKSMTTPDLNLTVRQLLENHTRGKTNEVEVRKPLYFELPIPVIGDLTDIDKYRKILDEQIKSTDAFKAQLDDQTKEYNKKEAKNAQRKEFLKEIEDTKKEQKLKQQENQLRIPDAE